MPVTLPTYVGKATAQRTVRTIDLDATGVWTSGRSEADSQLARDAEEAERAARDEKSRNEQRPRRRLLIRPILIRPVLEPGASLSLRVSGLIRRRTGNNLGLWRSW